MGRPVQQALPWGRREPPGAFDVAAGFCVHNRLVGFWEETPAHAQLSASGAVRMERIAAFRFQRELGRLCPFGCIDHSIKEDSSMGVVKSAPDNNPAPDGPQRVICVDNYTLKNVNTQWGPKDKEVFVFESEHIDPKTGKPFLLFARFIAILTPKAKLTEFLTSWRGRRFTDDEAKGFDCEKVVGANAMVNVLQDHKDDGKVYANITSIMPQTDRAKCLTPSGGYVRAKDRQAQPGGSQSGASAPADPDDDLPF